MGVREGEAEAKRGTGSKRSAVPLPLFAGKGDRPLRRPGSGASPRSLGLPLLVHAFNPEGAIDVLRGPARLSPLRGWDDGGCISAWRPRAGALGYAPPPLSGLNNTCRIASEDASLDVEDQLGKPPPALAGQAQAVVGDGLDLVVQDMPIGVDRLTADLGVQV